MRKLLFFTLFLFVSTRGAGQIVELDSILHQIEYKDDSVKAIFDWVTHEIKYNTKVLLLKIPTKYGLQPNNLIREVIRTRKGVCIHYALLFDALMKKAGYESYMVGGYTRDSFPNTREGHAWNVVRQGGQWYFYDPTWASGYVDRLVFKRRVDDNWYKVSPQKFIQTHIPFDPLWQFLKKPITNQQVLAGDFGLAEPVDGLDSAFSIEMKKPEGERLLSEIQRIESAGVTNNLIQEYLLMVEYNRQVTVMNDVSNTINAAINDFNKYLFAKNRYFENPKWSDEDLRQVPGHARARITQATELMNSCKSPDDAILRQIAIMKNHIQTLHVSIDQEEAFIEKYLATRKPLRGFLFLKKQGSQP